jgi:choline monooxygenase
MEMPLPEVVRAYDAEAPLEQAFTIPAPWYVDPRVAELERRAVFGAHWQMAARSDQLRETGQYVTTEVGGEPVVIVRGGDGVLRGFFNVCRHHAAAVMTEPEGRAGVLRCPYHGWTYSLEGALRGVPEFDGVCDFDRARNGLEPLAVDTWEGFVFVKLDPGGPSLGEHLGGMAALVNPLGLAGLTFVERRTYSFNCNWKVFVDNYLDGGYHVPHLHKGLNSVLEYKDYTIETGERFCLQSSPLLAGEDQAVAAVRRGDRALYFWLHPNFMLNWYEGVMDTNLVLARGLDRTLVVFDFYFADVSPAAAERNRKSVEVGQVIQDEDQAICESVQRGLHSRAYGAGRLSRRREAGEHLFHRLLAADLRAGLPGSRT